MASECLIASAPPGRVLPERYDPHTFGTRVPHTYPLRQYPDICHVTEAQYGLRSWSHVWAFTERRFAIGALPSFHERVIRQRAEWPSAAINVGASAYSEGISGNPPSSAAINVGASAYSEGISDDLHKVIWSALALEPARSLREVIDEYVRTFLGAECEHAGATDALMGLEANWQVPPPSSAPLMSRG